MNGLFTRRLALGILLGAAAFGVAGCTGNSDQTLLNAATATSNLPTVSDTFSGTITQNGAQTYPFSVNGAGQVTAEIITLTPNSVQLVGIALGTWNGSVCQIVLTNDAAVQSSAIVGQATALGNFCVRVYDSTGALPQPESFVVQVAHP